MKQIFYVLSTCLLTFSSCNSNISNGNTDERDSMQLVIDSFANKDIHLTFKGFTIGDSLGGSNEKGLYGDSISLEKKNDFIYQGYIPLSYINDNGNSRTEQTQIQLDLFNERIARISLLTDSWGICALFIDTFNERYYKVEPVENWLGGTCEETYTWLFKNQYIYIKRWFHLDPKYGVWHITDKVLIVYNHHELGKAFDAMKSKKDSLENEEKKRFIEEEKEKLKQAI